MAAPAHDPQRWFTVKHQPKASFCERVVDPSSTNPLLEPSRSTQPAVGHCTCEASSAARLEREAVDLAEKQHFQKAAELFGRAAQMDPGCARLHEFQAQCLLELDDPRGAREAAERAVEASPGWLAARGTLGRAFLNEGCLQDAVESLRLAVELGASSTSQAEGELAADLATDLAEARALLERHWSEYHDLLLQAPLVLVPLRIRQTLECSYCHLSGEQGPGGAVWASGAVLAQIVGQRGTDGQIPTGSNHPAWRGRRVLELGSGTGIAGLAAASAGAEVLLTDRVPLLPLLSLNVKLNAASLAGAGGSASCVAVDWSAPIPTEVLSVRWDVVLASDAVYSFASAGPFASALGTVLKSAGSDCCALYAHNPRSELLDAEMRAAFSSNGLTVESLQVPATPSNVGHINAAALRRVVLFRLTHAK